MKSVIAERKLLYSLAGSEIRNEFSIGIGVPYIVQEGMVDFSVGADGCYGCDISLQGLNEKCGEVYGADSLQAIDLASSAVEPFLKRLSSKYDLFYLSGEPYFDDEGS
jgi:hypothetical protein